MDYTLNNISFECAVCSVGDGMYEIQAKDARDKVHSVTIAQDGVNLPRTEFPSASDSDRFIFLDRYFTRFGMSRPDGGGSGATTGFLAVEGVINPSDNSVSLTFSSDEVTGNGAPVFGDYTHVTSNQYWQDSSLSADVIVPISEASGTSCSI